MDKSVLYGQKIFALWAVPRSRSTAFFRMMAQRGDFVVLHEPFSTLAEHGVVDLRGRRVTTEREVIDVLRELSSRHRVFFKDTTDERYTEVLADTGFLGQDVRSSFLIRDPAETIPSYYAINPAVARDQIGHSHLYELYCAVRSLIGRAPVLFDAADLVDDPPGLVRRYCAEMGIAFEPSALSWQVGDRDEWRATSEWHRDVSESTGFQRRPPRHGATLSDAPFLRGYLDHHQPYYRKLKEQRLRL